MLHATSDAVITANGIPLERVDMFRYLGRLLAGNNNDWPAVHHNLVKARRRWGMLSRVLINTGVAPKVVGLFYKVICQSVLLYACETWVMTNSMLETLRGFHHTVARQIANRRARRDRNGVWVRPPIEEALDIAGLYPIEHYIMGRRATMLAHIVNRPIYARCKQVSMTTARANSRLYRWWSQPPLQTAAVGAADAMAQPPSQIDPPARHPFFNRCGGGRYSGVELDVPTDDPPTPPVSPPLFPCAGLH